MVDIEKEIKKMQIGKSFIDEVSSSCEQHGLKLSNCAECVRDGIEKGVKVGKEIKEKENQCVNHDNRPKIFCSKCVDIIMEKHELSEDDLFYIKLDEAETIRIEAINEVVQHLQDWTQLHPAQYGQIKKGAEALKKR